MPISSDEIARVVARRMEVTTKDAALGASVEARLRGAAAVERFEPISMTIAVAGLIVSASKAAWDVYRDLQKERKDGSDPGAMHRRLRVAIDATDGVSPELRDAILHAVIDEITRSGSGDR